MKPLIIFAIPLIAMLSCKNQVLVNELNKQYTDNIEHYQNDIEEIQYQLHKGVYSIGNKQRFNKAVKYQQIAFKIDSFYQIKIKEVVKLESEYAKNNNNDLHNQIEQIVSFNRDTLLTLLCSPEEISQKKICNTNWQDELTHINNQIKKQDKTIYYPKRYESLLLKEEVHILKKCLAYSRGFTCGFGHNYLIAHIGKPFVKKNEANYVEIALTEDFYEYEYFIDDIFIEKTAQFHVMPDFKSSSIPGKHSVNLKIKIWYESLGDSVLIEKDLPYLVE